MVAIACHTVLRHLWFPAFSEFIACSFFTSHATGKNNLSLPGDNRQAWVLPRIYRWASTIASGAKQRVVLFMWIMKTSWDYQKKKLEAKNGLYYYPSRCKTKDVYLLRGIFMRGFAFKIDSQIGKLEDPENEPLSWTGGGAWDLSMSLVHHRYGATSPEGWPREAESRGDRAAYTARAIGPWVLTSLSEGLFHCIHLGRALNMQPAKPMLLFCEHIWMASKLVVLEFYQISH